MQPTDDVVIVGGGHNALVAATYLAQAGRHVTVLERQDHLGGAAVSAQTFAGVEARLSRYSYLVSLLPARVITELRLPVRMIRRRYSSYTPVPGAALSATASPGVAGGLLIDNTDPTATAASFASIGAASDAAAWSSFYADTARLARILFPTVCEPLMTRGEARRAVGDDRLWNGVVERPIGELIEESFTDDLVRGVVLTDALISTFAPAHDTGLDANRCFLYHVIGGGTGDWDVPVGGMGAVSGALESAARRAGATLVTGAEVVAVDPDGEVTYLHDGHERRIGARAVLSGVAPTVLDALLAAAGAAASGTASPVKPEGAQVKVNLLLRRLPRLRDATLDPTAAFGGTFHINETYGQLDRAYRAAATGTLPDPLPTEIYCHSLSDPSILSPELAASGAHTLTAFTLHTPDRLLDDPSMTRERLQRAVLDSIDSVLAEPIEPLLMTDAAGRPTIETKTTRDLENDLGLPGGNIFHAPLSWPFADDDAALGTPAAQWGVSTAHDRVLICGAGAVRGGGVSGLGGHNAAMALLQG